MIETKEQYERLAEIGEHGTSAGAIHLLYAMTTIEALRPFVRFMREERIVPIGNNVTSCTFCLTSWLIDPPSTYPGQEHHKTTCLLHGIPRWLGETESQDETD